MTWSKVIVSMLVGLVVALGLGFAWGAAGRSAAEKALVEARGQLDLADARGRLLDARVSLYNTNFGDARRSLEEAKTPLGRLRARYLDEGRRDAASDIDAALRHLDEAQRLAGKLDQAANSRADDALKALDAATRRGG